MDYYDNYYQLDNEDSLMVITDCYCTNHSICSYCMKGYN
jgi:hypothetical protein